MNARPRVNFPNLVGSWTLRVFWCAKLSQNYVRIIFKLHTLACVHTVDRLASHKTCAEWKWKLRLANVCSLAAHKTRVFAKCDQWQSVTVPFFFFTEKNEAKHHFNHKSELTGALFYVYTAARQQISGRAIKKSKRFHAVTSIVSRRRNNLHSPLRATSLPHVHELSIFIVETILIEKFYVSHLLLYSFVWLISHHHVCTSS